MIDLYYWPTPNAHKVMILLEECGLSYIIEPVNIGRGDQLSPLFLNFSVRQNARSGWSRVAVA